MEIKDIENLAELAKIELTSAEKEKLLSDLDGIISYVHQISEVSVEESNFEFSRCNIFKNDEDAVQPIFSRDLIIGQFPDKEDDFLKVKKIL